MDNRFGFVRISVVSPDVVVANPAKNVSEILGHIRELSDSDIILFPELAITGYTCGDLFQQSVLKFAVEDAIGELVKSTYNNNKQLIVVGAPAYSHNCIYNCAYVIGQGRILGVVPKTYIPNYNEFYELRHFQSGENTCMPFMVKKHETMLSDRLIFVHNNVRVFCEVCEDLWVPIPPSCNAALAGANILLNLSASNETVAKADYRVELVKNQSARCISAYAYASAGNTVESPGESTSDLVFSGHDIIAENGHVLTQSRKLLDSNKVITADIDIEKLNMDRANMNSFKKSSSVNFMSVPFDLADKSFKTLHRKVNGMPFVPRDSKVLHNRCEEIFAIQCAGLGQRLLHLNRGGDKKPQRVFIPVSGGLDSTLALLVAHKTFKKLGWPTSNICGISMPGFGTTTKTYENSISLMESLGVSCEVVDIREECFIHFRNNRMKPFGIDVSQMYFVEFLQSLKQVKAGSQDVQFENVQARKRTEIAMNRGFTLGTGDMSEAALGWCTYNGDHMSMYNVNCSIPKTLVKFLVEHVATFDYSGQIAKVLLDIAHTVISPELLPPDQSGNISQSTEEKIGPYILHDFFLQNFVRHRFTPSKIVFLSQFADFPNKYSEEEVKKTLRIFLTRFFDQQYKRDCVPNGPKVGSVSLSPRGDWRMPSDADSSAWLKDLSQGASAHWLSRQSC